MANPGDNNYELARLYERLAELERRVGMLERAPVSSVELGAMVTAYPGSGNTCTVTYPSGVSRVVRVMYGYLPVVNDEAIIVNDVSGEGSVVGRKS